MYNSSTQEASISNLIYVCIILVHNPPWAAVSLDVLRAGITARFISARTQAGSRESSCGLARGDLNLNEHSPCSMQIRSTRYGGALPDLVVDSKTATRAFAPHATSRIAHRHPKTTRWAANSPCRSRVRALPAANCAAASHQRRGASSLPPRPHTPRRPPPPCRRANLQHAVHGEAAEQAEREVREGLRQGEEEDQGGE